MQHLDGKVAVVTGAASGIGLALARQLASEGLRLVLADTDEQGLNTAAAEFNALAVPVDVSEQADLTRLADAAFARYEAVHLLVNNAGVAPSRAGPVWDAPLEDWRWVLDVNLMGVVHGLRAFVPRMLAGVAEGLAADGHIVNVASLAGLVTFPQGGPYAASKHAVVAVSEQTALALGELHAPVGVTVVCPAWVRTDILRSERLRPAALKTGDEVAAPHTIVAAMESTGRDPAALADDIVEAVRAGRFLVTDPSWEAAITDRAARLVEGVGPVLPAPSA